MSIYALTSNIYLIDILPHTTSAPMTITYSLTHYL